MKIRKPTHPKIHKNLASNFFRSSNTIHTISILKSFLQLHIEFRPESYDGIILLTGERDDLTGDFMAVLIHQGFIEFW